MLQHCQSGLKNGPRGLGESIIRYRRAVLLADDQNYCLVSPANPGCSQSKFSTELAS